MVLGLCYDFYICLISVYSLDFCKCYKHLRDLQKKVSKHLAKFGKHLRGFQKILYIWYYNIVSAPWSGKARIVHLFCRNIGFYTKISEIADSLTFLLETA